MPSAGVNEVGRGKDRSGLQVSAASVGASQREQIIENTRHALGCEADRRRPNVSFCDTGQAKGLGGAGAVMHTCNVG